MKKILVPTDYTSLSLNALDFALDVAKAAGAQVDVVYFLNTPIEAATFNELLSDGDTFKSEFFDVDMIKSHQHRLDEIANGRKAKGVKISTAVGGSGVVNGSQKYVEKYGVDLIIVGADAEKEIEDPEFDISVGQEMLEYIGIPVISMTDHVDYVDLTDIVLGIDLSEEKYPSKAVPVINSVAESFGAKIHLVNIVKTKGAESSQLEALLNDFAKEAGFKNFDTKVIEHNNELEGLLLYADKIGAGLIATISDARPGLFRFFKDSFATTMVKATDLPVLVLNKKNLR